MSGPPFAASDFQNPAGAERSPALTFFWSSVSCALFEIFSSEAPSDGGVRGCAPASIGQHTRTTIDHFIGTFYPRRARRGGLRGGMPPVLSFFRRETRSVFGHGENPRRLPAFRDART